MLVIAAPISAQEATPEADVEDHTGGPWSAYDFGAMQVQVPGWFSLTDEGDDTLTFDTPDGDLLIITVTTPFDGGEVSIDLIRAEYGGSVAEGGEILDEGRIDLPTGSAYQITAQLEANIPIVQREVFVPLGAEMALLTFVTFPGIEAEPSPEETTFDVILHTIQREGVNDELAWPAFTSDDGVLTLQAPLGWERDAAVGDVFVLTQPEDLPLLILSSTQLDIQLDADGFVDRLVRQFEDDGDTLIDSGVLHLPAGDAAYAIADSPVEFADGTSVPQRQHRYVIVSGTTLINVTFSVNTPLIEAYTPIIETMLHTLRVNTDR